MWLSQDEVLRGSGVCFGEGCIVKSHELCTRGLCALWRMKGYGRKRTGMSPAHTEAYTRGSSRTRIKVVCLFVCFVFHFWKRERMSEGGEERDRGTEDPKQALCWQQRTQCRAWTHEMWDHDLSWSWMLNWLSHPGAPRVKVLTRGSFSLSFLTPEGLNWLWTV